MHTPSGIIQLPLLLRGKLCWPDPVPEEEICFSLREKGYARHGTVQALRLSQGAIVTLPHPTSPDQLIAERWHPPGLQTAAVLDLLAQLQASLQRQRVVLPTALPDSAISMMLHALEPERAGRQLDTELSRAGTPGSAWMDRWVDTDAVPHSAHLKAHSRLFSRHPLPEPPPRAVRARGLRHLHVCPAGAPAAPALSLARSWITQSAAVIKLSSAQLIAGAMLSLAVAELDADHPLRKGLSIAYWPGGTHPIEAALLEEDRFDRVVVWGHRETIRQYRSRTNAEIIAHPDRSAAGLIVELPGDDLSSLVAQLTADVLWREHGCDGLSTVLVCGSPSRIDQLCERLAQSLAEWDRVLPAQPPDAARLRALRRGMLFGARWWPAAEPAPGSVVIRIPHPLESPPDIPGRVCVISPIRDIDEALPYLALYQTIAVAPESARKRLRDRLVAAGADCVSPLGGSSVRPPAAPMDGTPVLARLVRWVIG